MNKNRIAIYPGTFDPLTLGHLDIIERSANMFDKIIVAIGENPSKTPLFSIEERIDMIEKATAHLKNIEVIKFHSLLVDLSTELDANIIIRGIRSSTDFEYEQQMGYANVSLKKEIETIYLMPKLEYSFISSSVVRAILKFGGEIDHLVPKSILNEIKSKGKK